LLGTTFPAAVPPLFALHAQWSPIGSGDASTQVILLVAQVVPNRASVRLGGPPKGRSTVCGAGRVWAGAGLAICANDGAAHIKYKTASIINVASFG
jgi:hypothetical protein